VLSNNSFLARILEIENAETFGSVELDVVDCIFVGTDSLIFTEVATVISTFGSSATGAFSTTCLASTIE
jgi:hypothetical protein